MKGNNNSQERKIIEQSSGLPELPGIRLEELREGETQYPEGTKYVLTIADENVEELPLDFRVNRYYPVLLDQEAYFAIDFSKNNRLKEIPPNVFKRSLVTYADLSGCTDMMCIGEAAFKGTTSLKEVRFPKNLRQINACAFMMTGLRDVDLSETRIETLQGYAFGSPFGLQRIVMPATLRKVSAYVLGSPISLNLSDVDIDISHCAVLQPLKEMYRTHRLCLADGKKYDFDAKKEKIAGGITKITVKGKLPENEIAAHLQHTLFNEINYEPVKERDKHDVPNIEYTIGTGHLNMVDFMNCLVKQTGISKEQNVILDLTEFDGVNQIFGPIPKQVKHMILPKNLVHADALFIGCNSIDTVDMSKCRNVTNMCKTFAYSSVKHVKMPVNVTDIKMCFITARQLKTVDMSECRHLENAESAFKYCKADRVVFAPGAPNADNVFDGAIIGTLDLSGYRGKKHLGEIAKGIRAVNTVIVPEEKDNPILSAATDSSLKIYTPSGFAENELMKAVVEAFGFRKLEAEVRQKGNCNANISTAAGTRESCTERKLSGSAEIKK